MSAQEQDPGLAEARRQVEELQVALTRRTLIARAQGVLMERYGMTESAAIGVLKRVSMQTQVRVHDLAAQVLDGAALEDLQAGRHPRAEA